MQRYLIALTCLALPAATLAAAQCTLIETIDGDTVEARCDGVRVDLHLHCIDAPERDQAPWARKATYALEQQLDVAGGRFRAEIHATDPYGRKIATITVPLRQREGRLDVNRWLVAAGRAAVYDRYCDRKSYLEAEERARRNDRGIWAEPGLHQRPWVYRERE